jgi:hypothetical protein
MSMKSMTRASLAALLVLLAGCATTFRPWNLSQIEEGMSRAEVVRILGEPDSMAIKNGAELLYYTYMESYNPPLSDDSIHSGVSDRRFWDRQMVKGFKEYRYSVKLVDGKVLSYREITD